MRGKNFRCNTDGTCWWWNSPSDDEKEQAQQAILAKRGPHIAKHVIISSKEWADRMSMALKPKTGGELEWQRSHYSE